jgi:hypothetical protein
LKIKNVYVKDRSKDLFDLLMDMRIKKDQKNSLIQVASAIGSLGKSKENRDSVNVLIGECLCLGVFLAKNDLVEINKKSKEEGVKIHSMFG